MPTLPSLQQISSIFSYWLNATSVHSLQSPLAYEWHTQVISPNQKIQEKTLNKNIEVLRRSLGQRMDTIQLTEMGARSKYDRGNNRTVRSIVNGSTSAAKFSRLYQRIIEYTKSKHIVELGTSLGINTCYLALRPNSKVYSLEGCPNLLQLAKENIATIGLDNIELLLGNIDTTLPSLLARVPSLDFVFFDANHRYEPTLAYFELCLNYRHEHSIFIFDDIHWSEGMEKAWAKIKARPEVSMTIDLYRSGIVLFNEGQTAQHHIISF